MSRRQTMDRQSVQYAKSVRWCDSDSAIQQMLEEKFSVQDVKKMFNLPAVKDMSPSSSDNFLLSNANLSDMRLVAILSRLKTPVIESDLDIAEHLRVLMPRLTPSGEILLVPSDETDDLEAAQDTSLPEKKIQVEQEVRDHFIRCLKHRVGVPNSVIKRPPELVPPPKPTVEQMIQLRVMREYAKIYGEDKPRPKYPILPPRPPRPRPEPKPKKRKGRKQKKKKEPDEPFDMTKWRKEEIPVASVKLDRLSLPVPAYQQYTPDISQPPSPPPPLPQPITEFGEFINTVPVDRHPKKVSNKGHYEPRPPSFESLVSLVPAKRESVVAPLGFPEYAKRKSFFQPGRSSSIAPKPEGRGSIFTGQGSMPRQYYSEASRGSVVHRGSGSTQVPSNDFGPMSSLDSQLTFPVKASQTRVYPSVSIATVEQITKDLGFSSHFVL